MKKIVTLTVNPALDKSTSVGTVASEIKLRCARPTFDPGGGGINVSRAVKKLGGESLAIYTSGGPYGEMLGQLLERESIQQQPITIKDHTRESFTVFEESSTLQYRFGMPGPDMDEDEWERCIEAVLATEADYVVGSGSLAPGMPVDFYAQLTRRLAGRDTKVIVDTSGPALRAMETSGVYLLKPNLAEVETITGREFESEDQLRDLAREIIRGGTMEVVVISMGASGAAFITADDYAQLRPPVVPIKSKVGAGDSMVGGLVLGLAQGRDLLDAVRYGIAAGTAAVMTPGTQLCRKEDTDSIYERVSITRG